MDFLKDLIIYFIIIFVLYVIKKEDINSKKKFKEREHKIDSKIDNNLNQANINIVVPDEVNYKKSSRTSTQARDYKVYKITGDKKTIEKVSLNGKIASESRNNEYTNDEDIKNLDSIIDVCSKFLKNNNIDEDDDNPIKEKQSFLSKLFPPKDEL